MSVCVCVFGRESVCAIVDPVLPSLSPPPAQRSVGYHFFPDNVLSTRCLFSRNARQKPQAPPPIIPLYPTRPLPSASALDPSPTPC